MALINCKKCGCQMSDKSEACPVCGMPVGMDVDEYNKRLEASYQQGNNDASQENQPSEVMDSTQFQEEQPRRKGKTGLIIGIVAGVIVIAAVIALFVMRSNKEQALAEQQVEGELQLLDQQAQNEAELTEHVLEAYNTHGIYELETSDFQEAREAATAAEKASGKICIDWDYYYCTQDDYPDRINISRVDFINPNKANVYVELIFDREVFDREGHYQIDNVVLVMVREFKEEKSVWLVDDVWHGEISIKEEMKEFTRSVLEEVAIDEPTLDLGSRFVVIDGSQLRLRLGPSTSSDTFKWPDGTNRHPNVGDKYRYLGESGDFYKIDFNGYELWVSKQYTHIEVGGQTNNSNQTDIIINESSSHKVVEEIAPSIVVEEVTADQEIYQIVEEMPQFPGGDAKLLEYLAAHINYPKDAQDAGVQGRVFVGFVVEPDGSVSNVKVLRGIGSGCDEEAVRVIKSLPLFKPGKQHGKAVRVSYQIPVLFKLQ